MVRTILHCLLIVFVACSCIALVPLNSDAARTKVLVVMSYEEDFPWVREQKEGIDAVLGDSCDIKYFYLDTKRHFSTGAEKAKEAFELYLSFAPDGVIVGDDDAQSMFVVPYLRDKVKTPVMFCGVNAEPEKYGYPASNVSGVLERIHIFESISLVRQLVPSIKSIGFMMKESPVAMFVKGQVKQESASYPVRSVGFKTPKTLKEAVAMAEELKKSADLLFVETLEGIPDDEGRPLKDKEVMPIIARTFGKATIGTNSYAVQYGLLAAVVKTGQEQGSTAAKMLQQAMQGTSVSQLPVTRNYSGKRMINVSAMKALGIAPKPVTLRGVELIK